MAPVLSLEHVSKSFKVKRPQGLIGLAKELSHRFSGERLVVLDDVSFEVEKGEILGIIGRNGSGKTTLLKIISGIYQPNQGSVRIEGKISPLLSIGTGFHRELKAEENIILAGMLLGLEKSEIKKRVSKIIEFAELQDMKEMKLKHYSSGMKARLAFATALQIEPDILLVDEILSVGDMRFRRKGYNEFLKFKEEKKTILFVSHSMGAIKKLCDRVILLDFGKVVDIGLPEDIVKKYEEISMK